MINAISRKIFLFIIITVFLLMTQATISFAYGDFKVTSAETIEVCSCSSVPNNIKILNTDPISYIKTTYSISTSGEAAEFFSLAYPAFKLNGGESIIDFGYITAPCSAKGDYDLFIDIKTSSGISKRIKQIISIKRCDNLGLYAYDNDETINPCETADYSFIIKNTGDFTEKYIIGVDQLAQYVSLSANPVTIKAGESRQIYMYIKPECSMIDDKEIKVTVISSKNRLSAELPFILRINPDYYNYDMSIEDTRYTVCADSRNVIIPVTIKNYADKDSEIWLELDGEAFAELEEEEIIIAGSSEKSVDILLNSPDVRDEGYDFTIYAESKAAGIRKSVSFKVDVESCYGFAIEHKNFRANHSKQTIPINLISTAEKTARYTLQLDGPSWLSLETQEISLEPGESKQAVIISEPSDSVKGKYYAIIKAYPDTDNSIFYKEEFTITISDKEGFMAIVAEIFSNIYFLFAAIDIVLIILAVLLFKHLTKTKGRGTKQKTLTDIAKPEEVPSSKTKDVKIVKSADMSDKEEEQPVEEGKTEKIPKNYKPLLFILGGILILILIIIFSLYAYKNFIGQSASILGNIGQGIAAGAVLLFVYKWYITCIILIAIAVILLITTSIGKRIAVWKKKFFSQAIIIIIAVIVILSLLTAGFYFYRDNGFSKDWSAGINESLDNESQVKDIDILNNVSQDYGTEGLPEDEVIEGDIEGEIAIEEEAKKKITEEDIKALEGPILEWGMNNNMTLDLTKMFHDPDGDMLHFSANSTEHIEISIDMLTGIATLIPEQNWIGISDVFFSVNDGKGGIATSGKINIVVWEKDPRGVMDKITDAIPTGIRTSGSFIIDYGYYIIAGFIILLIFIIITRNNKDLISFPEEEMPPEEEEEGEEKKKKDSKKPVKKGKKKTKKKN
ncbi:MAG: hypothetical protein KAI26_03875 [Nanoarchaeota archaeon]|nr:hypothetical protein [Nanoarchaeota archaeon]